VAGLVRALLERAIEGPGEGPAGEWLAGIERRAAELAALRRDERSAILLYASDAGRDLAEALEMLETMRWLDRLGYHTWRICLHLGQHGRPAPANGRDSGMPPDPDPASARTTDEVA